MHQTGNLRILERLVAEGLLTPEHQEGALNRVRTLGERVEEALLEVQAMDEATLLKWLAQQHRTRFVSTDKLAKADIDRLTLDKVPRNLAEKHTIFPVLYDTEKSVLSVVTPDPEDLKALEEVQFSSGVREVRAFVGRPRAVKAAISKAYQGDIHAFATLDRTAHEQFQTMLDVYERQLITEESVTTSLISDEGRRERVLDPTDLEAPSGGAGVGAGARGVATESYLETLNVLITLVEDSRQDLRGHSSHVARFVKKLAERIGLPQVQTASMAIAAYIHDLGKMGSYHLTALNVAEYEGHRTAAQKARLSPSRLLEAVQLPREALRTVDAMYERYDGLGVPGGDSGKDIPLGARILAIADTYADLTQNPRNPYRKALRPVQACEVLARYRGTVFDPNLVDLFRITVTGDDVRARLLANRYRALIVDPDPEESTVLELRMIEQGFEVVQARSSDQAIKLLERGDVQLVVSEIDVKPEDGFALLGEAGRQAWGRGVPWVVVSGRSGGTDAKRAFELGAVDFMTKPVNVDLLIAKLKQYLERAAVSAGTRGVSGSLAEMSWPDMVQVLWHARKTGSLKIRSGSESGEIHFVGGAIYNALWEKLRGEDAFYAMLRLADGEFSLDPNYVAPQQEIQESPEALLLEGMRRLDESGR
jgi:response regulator RpfG family c-di-GMP phosphodiesterase